MTVIPLYIFGCNQMNSLHFIFFAHIAT